MANNRVLLLDDDSAFLKVISYYVEKEGFDALSFTNPIEGLEEAKRNPVDIVITDMKMPELSGINCIKKLRSFDEEAVVIAISGLGSIDDAIEAMKLGAIDFIRKPIEQEHFCAVLNKAKKLYDLTTENRRLKGLVTDKFGFGAMVGSAPSMQEMFNLAERVAPSQTNVLINGETGAGKEVLAKALHINSLRKDASFVAINCAAVPTNLIESELFGHIKGAFTGANSDRKGLLSEADGGTFFMDEIGDLPLELQPKLLRVIQENEFTPVGSNMVKKIDIRFIAATHRNLEEMVQENLFREDLFYRLNVINLVIPPIRERTEDILPLFTQFLENTCKRENRTSPSIAMATAKKLEEYHWPGNVREIQNCAQRCAVLCGDTVLPADLPFKKNSQQSDICSGLLNGGSFNLEEYIDNLFIKALRKNNWNQTKTAEFLQITRNTMIYRMKRDALQKAFLEDKE